MVASRVAIRPRLSMRKGPARPRRRAAPRSIPRVVEALEGRRLLATFSVTSLQAAGAGSLRRAILLANAAPGPDAIDFVVSGTIRVGRAGLPAITDPVTIDGGSAPSFAGLPRVTVDLRGTSGLTFARGSDGSALRSLSVVRARGAGVTLDASRIAVQGNFIGLAADGTTADGNRGDGVRINASSHGDLIGDSDPVTGVTYYDSSGVSIQPVSGWQGIRAGDAPGQYVLTGTSGSEGLLYIGPISGVGGTSYPVNVPGAATSSVYGPDDLGHGLLRLVGSYRDGAGHVRGFLFQGTTADLSDAGAYRTIAYPGAQFTYVHSTMGGLAVGNADGPEANLPLGPGHAFLYDVAQDKLLPDIVYPDSISTTAYGIWHNGGTSYTIAGGYTGLDGQGRSIARGYLVDYDSATGQYAHWTSFQYPNGIVGQDYITHFEGISSAEKGVYTLVADSVQRGTTNPAQGSFVTVRRTTDGGFDPADSAWVDLNFPGGVGISSANSVAGNQVVGIVIGPPTTPGGAPTTLSFQATINTGFRLSNVIAANGGNGIGIYGSDDNRIAMNFIGTDATGTVRRGNAGDGIRITGGAARNLVGGPATGGNDPTMGVFVRPPQGNLISANRGDGMRIDRGATSNQLSGNFVGTTADGSAALGNLGDGVAIVGADDNRLIGCTFQQDPFVFYNVISGNRGNGLRIQDSDGTTIQANFLGAGADNATVVPNGGDGLLVSGRSRDTLTGGLIPLGNVISGNDRNGIEVRDRASGFTSYNTFGGTFAFGGAAPNRGDGIRITSGGADNLLIVNIFSGNRGDGISIGGHAAGVQVVETIVGLDAAVHSAIPNGGSGIRIWGHALGTIIGGPPPADVPGGQPVVTELPVMTSGNLGPGLSISGRANDTVVIHTLVGTNPGGDDLGNGLGGIDLGPGTSGATIGGTSAVDRVKVAFNRGDGLSIRSSRRNAIAGADIVNNRGFGLFASGDCAGTVVRDSTIAGNLAGDVDVKRARGLIYIPAS